MTCTHGSATTERLLCFNAVLVANTEFDFDNFFTLRFPAIGTIKLTRSKIARCSKIPFLFKCML